MYEKKNDITLLYNTYNVIILFFIQKKKIKRLPRDTNTLYAVYP